MCINHHRLCCLRPVHVSGRWTLQGVRDLCLNDVEVCQCCTLDCRICRGAGFEGRPPPDLASTEASPVSGGLTAATPPAPPPVDAPSMDLEEVDHHGTSLWHKVPRCPPCPAPGCGAACSWHVVADPRDPMPVGPCVCSGEVAQHRAELLKSAQVWESPEDRQAAHKLLSEMVKVLPWSKKKKKERPTVPEDVREIARWTNSARSGLEFALLTGDFNPIHWIPAYARVSGFKNTILHGFGTMARAIEALDNNVFAGATPIRSFSCRFTRPVVLPARVGVYVAETGGERRVWVGDAPGGTAYMQGTFSTETPDI